MQTTSENRLMGFFLITALVVVLLVPIVLLYRDAVRASPLVGEDLRLVAGFLGTGASRASDVSLLAYVFLLVPGMIYGYVAARRQLFVPQHKYAMTFVTVLNWALIAYVMGVSFSGAVPYYENRDPSKLIIPLIHLITGGIAQVLATVSLIRMWFEYQLPPLLRYEPIKPQMRLTLALWLITAALGIGIYITWYGVPLQPRPETPAEQVPPEGTPEATQDPNATPLPAATEDPNATPTAAAPSATEEATAEPTPAATEDVSMNDNATKITEKATKDAADLAEKATKAAEDAAEDATKDAGRATKKADD